MGGAKDDVNVLNPQEVREKYLADMQEAARRVRAVAPNVRIIIPGMPQISNGPWYCAVNIAPDRPGGVAIPWLGQVENYVQANQREAADAIGGEFIDIKADSIGHDSCAPDAQRYVAGVIDTTTPHYNLIGHPSLLGSQFIADEVAARL